HKMILEKDHISKSNPSTKLVKGPNIWNVVVIDNIDFKNIVFKYRNIYDVIRQFIYATLRMVFQFELPFSISSLTQENPNPQENLFGQLVFTSEWNDKFDQIIEQLLNKYKKNFGVKEINNEILTIIESKC
ncbi:13725_t:CDS:1, partial [Racocetra fulgida]